ncbi:unnamed protein product [Fusarium venenatum]|uniref:Uncharacterized protein n=1 Tax=Fusarium venenatum TaxID=56646 RepID=A0A2L2THM2_9HYPO|nr:uncharacterized protein FVRRES_12528 [Fusarium venenatum]CEI39837.1 unnamed protein product [Fusarium venenatum]
MVMNRRQGIRIIDHDDSQIERLNDSNESTCGNQAVQHRLAKWRITLRQPAIMCLFFLCGIALAIGHHVFYQSMCLPLASIAPPATLSVGLDDSTSTRNISIPDFNRTVEWLLERNTNGTVYNYLIPTSNAHLYAKRVAYRGIMLAPTAPAPYSTFQYSFYGPSVNCRRSTKSEDREFAIVAEDLFRPIAVYSNTKRNKVQDPGYMKPSSGENGAYYSVFRAFPSTLGGIISGKYDVSQEELRQGGNNPVLATGLTAYVSTTEVHYQYSPRRLALSYALAAFATLLFLLAGFWAIYSNDVVHDSSFSSLLYTTCNAELDTAVINAGLSLGAETNDGTLDDV